MQPATNTLRYLLLYARKSSESEDRQVQSIEDQVNRLKELASDSNLDIREIYTEAKSAKTPNNRPVFNKMMEQIEKGEADGILCWQINRLSRNPIDSGRISWLLQGGILKSIQTVDRQYLPKEVEDRSKIYEMRHKTVVQTQNQLDTLVGMRYRDLITDEEYTRERNRLQNQITQIKVRLRETENRAEQWLKLTEQTFDFATYARQSFITGDLQTKKEILIALGQNPTIKDGKLSIQANKWLQPIGKSYPSLEVEYGRLEPRKKPMNKEQTKALTSIRSRWCTIVHDVRTKIQGLGPSTRILDIKLIAKAA